MKHFAAILVLASTVTIISGCSNKAATPPTSSTPTLSSGNWLIVETGVSVLSTASGGSTEAFNANLRGPLTISTSTITGSLSGNDQAPMDYSGTVSGDKITLDSAPDFNGESFALAGSVNTNGTILGTYTLENGYNGLTSTGTIYGTDVPAVTGTWTGTLAAGFAGTSTYPVSTVNAELKQAAVATIIGNVSAFALSGTVAFSNASCTDPGPLSLTIDPTASYISGDEIVFTAYSADFTQSFTWKSSLDNPTTATATSNGTYAVSSSTCPSVSGIKTGVLTKQ